MKSKMFALRLPESMDEDLTVYARLHGQTKSGVVKMALYQYLRQREK